MAQITSLLDMATLVATRRQDFDIIRGGTLTTAIGNLGSSWLESGSMTGAVPGAAAVPTKATTGALANFTNPGGGEFCHLYSFEASFLSNSAGFLLYDRLVHHGGLSSVDTTLQNVNTPAITRGDTTGHGVEGFVEVYVQLGGTPQTLTVSYTNQAGTAGQITTVAIPGTARLGRLLPIPLLTGDTGIRSIETVQLGGSTGTAGSYGVTLGRRISAAFPEFANRPAMLTGLECDYPKIEADACLWMVYVSSTSSSPGASTVALSIVTTG